MQLLSEVRLFIKSLFFGLLLLAGCQTTRGASYPVPNGQNGPAVENLPSISELAGSPSLEIPPLPILNQDEIASGRGNYSTYCAECHGENLEGEDNWQIQNEDRSFRSPPHDADGHTWHHGDRVLIEAIELGGSRLPDNIGGTSNMPAFKGTLTEGEIAAVLVYIKSSWPEDIRRIQWGQTIMEQNQ